MYGIWLCTNFTWCYLSLDIQKSRECFKQMNVFLFFKPSSYRLTGIYLPKSNTSSDFYSGSPDLIFPVVNICLISEQVWLRKKVKRQKSFTLDLYRFYEFSFYVFKYCNCIRWNFLCCSFGNYKHAETMNYITISEK